MWHKLHDHPHPVARRHAVLGHPERLAIAMAGGFTRRSAKTRITIQRFNQTQGMEETVTEDSPVGPGDIIRVPERWF
jgi:polysaccharide export outer membrane protein